MKNANPSPLLILGLATQVLCSGASAADSSQRPNILFLFSDDHGSQAISAYAGKDALVQTPNIDRIAREGALFLNNFCANAICSPSRATILTGTHSHINGLLGNERQFVGTQPTLPLILRKAGYQTAIVGKWHLVTEPVGFDHWKVLPGQGYYYNPDFRTPDGIKRIEGHSTEIIADLAIDYIDAKGGNRDSTKPFFLMAQFKAPHRNQMPSERRIGELDDREIREPDTLLEDPADQEGPIGNSRMSMRRDVWFDVDLKLPPGTEPKMDAPNVYERNFDRMTPDQRAMWDSHYGPRNEKWAAMGLSDDPKDDARLRAIYQRWIKDYLRITMDLDDQIGRILDALDKAGLAENTLVIYSTDQGMYLGERGMFDKRWMYDISMHMALAMRWPSRIPAGTIVEEQTQNIDFAPTILAAAGVPIPPRMQGVNLLPLAEGEPLESPRDALYYAYYETDGYQRVPPHDGIRTPTHKLIHFWKPERWELYDLQTDPNERNNLYGNPEAADTQKSLQELYKKTRTAYKAPPPGTLVPKPINGPAPVLDGAMFNPED